MAIGEQRPRLGFGTALLCLLAGAIAAAAYAAVSYANLRETARVERAELSSLADSFLQAYSESGGHSKLIPLRYFERALSTFAEANRNAMAGPVSITMVGLPRRALRRPTTDPALRRIVERLGATGTPKPFEESLRSGGQWIDRSIIPLFGGSQACIDCHTSEAIKWVPRIGEVMGAYVVDSDLSGPAIEILRRAIAVFLVATLAFLGIARREQARFLGTVAALEARVREQERREVAEEEAQRLAWQDPLTGIGNRAAFNRYVAEAFADHNPLLLALIDLDEFKMVNDRYGHAAGDALLIAAAERIAGVAASLDASTARLGGDEFAMLLRLESTTPSPAAIGTLLVERLTQPVAVDGTVLHPKSSVGIAVTQPGKMRSFEDLSRAADIALYDAKHRGRGGVGVYDANLHAEVIRQRDLTADFPAALAADEFELRFQPQFVLETGALRGFEALVRWQRGGVLIFPDNFIPVLERSGQIRALDLWVLKTALKALAAWSQSGLDPVAISVNISATHLISDDLVTAVKDALAASGVPGERLTLEITETVLLDRRNAAVEVISAIRRLGVGVALDDFGTGYSSLAYLRTLPVDEIKIDRAFVTDIETSQETRFMLDGLVDIAIGLGRSLVVEGIETEAQRALIAGFGAHVGQGFLFGEPLGAAEAAQMIADARPRRKGADGL